MGIGDMFGFGKKEPFRVPQEVVMLRTRIAAEERENYPNLARFKEMQRDASIVYKKLKAIIAQKDHAEDATRILEDLKKKMETLEAKIAGNMQAATSEGAQDYVADNMEYLERKSTRNAAKTLFTEFLEAHEMLVRRKGASAQGAQVLAATSKILQTLSDLQGNYFSKHRQDREIRGLQEKMCEKLSELKGLHAEVMASVGDHAARVAVEENLRKIAAFAEDCS